MNTRVSSFRYVAVAEGVSFLVLLVIAMPLKYFMGIPEAVKYAGWAHGVLFVLYIPFLLMAAPVLKWGFLKIVKGFLASLIPGGTFLLDRQIGNELKKSTGLTS